MFIFLRYTFKKYLKINAFMLCLITDEYLFRRIMFIKENFSLVVS